MTRLVLRQRMTPRVLANLLAHVLIFTAIYTVAFFIVEDFNASAVTKLLVTAAGVVIIKAVFFYSGGHCHRSWHDISFADLYSLLRSATLATLFITAGNYFLQYRTASQISPRVVAADWALTILVLGGVRATARLLREEIQPRIFGGQLRRVLILGANKSGETLARHLAADRRLKYTVVGFLDADKSRYGQTLVGSPILGHPRDALRIAETVAAEDLLVISGVLTGKELRSLVTECGKAGVTVKVLPALEELIAGGAYSAQLRDVDINDLLRREPVQLSNDDIKTLLAGRVVMVTGAGGSIGSEICRQLLRFHPSKVIMVEQAENSLFLIDQELRRTEHHSHLEPCIADITDRMRLEQIFGQHRPDIVFHAAAHKHVPMMEFNPGEAIKNNVVGTMQLAELADEFGVQEFVMISTDKAVNPTSVMGASKQIAERFVHALSEQATTKFVAVRFGNVLNSNGSVVPIFQEQIRRGGPITVTHPDIERFFMTIPEATQLVLQAASMGKGGEIFVLDMGEPVRIVDLARDLIRLSGLQEDDIDIVFTGLRPGEKLYEELYFDSEAMQPTPHPKVFVAYHRPCRLAEVRNMILQLAKAVHDEPADVRNCIQEWIPEYDPNGVMANRAENKPTEETPGVRLPQRRTSAGPAQQASSAPSEN